MDQKALQSVCRKFQLRPIDLLHAVPGTSRKVNFPGK